MLSKQVSKSNGVEITVKATAEMNDVQTYMLNFSKTNFR